MTLCIIFEKETVPFLLSEVSEEEVLATINLAKKNFTFSRQRAIVESDRVVLHAIPKTAKPKKRLYCYHNKVILQTDTLYPEEIESTRALLAYERQIPERLIQVVEV